MASHGFWPFAHNNGSYSTTLDDSGTPPKTIEQTEFLCKQIQMESDADQYSAPFGPDLLPGMYSTPVLTVAGKGELCLYNHHSCGKLALNSMIDQDDIARVNWMASTNLNRSVYSGNNMEMSLLSSLKVM
jgi:hypothetical protein